MVSRSMTAAGPKPRTQRIISPPGAIPDYQPADIEFRQLRYFMVVAEELHFGRAAARLYITQPGLSQAIARLERLLEVQLFTRTRSSVELTEAGAELLHRARRLLADLDGAVTGVRMTGRGQAGLIRIGVAHLAEPVIAPALTAFQAEHPSIVIDRAAMVSERLLEQLADGRLHATVIYRVPTLPPVDAVMSEALRRGRLAVLAGQQTELADRPMVTLSELSKQTFLVNPRSLAPGAFEGLKLMCREFGGFEANVTESAVATTVALGTDWRPIRDGTAIAVLAETTAHALRADGITVVPIQPPPQYVIALAWRHDEHAAAVHRFLAYLRHYRDQHAWITDPDVAPLTHDRGPSPIAGSSWTQACAPLTGDIKQRKSSPENSIWPSLTLHGVPSALNQVRDRQPDRDRRGPGLEAWPATPPQPVSGWARWIAGTCNQSFACVDSNGTFTTLPDPPGLSCGGAAAINNNGQVLSTCADGSQASTNNTRAVVWTNGTPTVLPTLGGPTTTATAINNNGGVTGYAQTSTFAQHGFLYSNATMTDLGNNIFMYAINDSDVMVGNDLIVSNGTVQDINNLIPPGDPGLNYAVGINDNGQIIAETNGILLTPN